MLLAEEPQIPILCLPFSRSDVLIDQWLQQISPLKKKSQRKDVSHVSTCAHVCAVARDQSQLLLLSSAHLCI